MPDTTLAELQFHNTTGVDTIRYTFHQKQGKILDLTQAKIARKWGYIGGEDYMVARALAAKAQASGFNVIRYPSERGMGANLAIFNDFDKLL